MTNKKRYKERQKEIDLLKHFKYRAYVATITTHPYVVAKNYWFFMLCFRSLQRRLGLSFFAIISNINKITCAHATNSLCIEQ